jgi:hypothetical protein
MDEEYLLFRTELAPGVWQAFDPWRVGRLLAEALGESLAGVVALARSPDLGEARPAAARLYAAAREAFGLPEVAADGSGYTERTVLRVFNEFVRFQAAQKKTTASSPTSSPRE